MKAFSVGWITTTHTHAHSHARACNYYGTRRVDRGGREGAGSGEGGRGGE